eukprot:2396688-Pyramimonas_sp.AAC.3
MRTAKLPVDVGDVYQPSTASSPGPVHTGSGARAWLTHYPYTVRTDPCTIRTPQALRAAGRGRVTKALGEALNLPLVMTPLHHATLLFARTAPILRTKCAPAC